MLALKVVCCFSDVCVVRRLIGWGEIRRGVNVKPLGSDD